MIGGLFKSASRLALVAAAGVIVGGVAVPSAKAADLGGDCCADLEERVAELEATTARKGNRKMSLTVTGQVHRMVMWYDDGQRSNAYYGLDNTNSSSRFSFIGNAKVTPKVSVGFDITIEIEAGGTSSKASQFDEDGKVGAQIAGSTGVASFNASNADSYFGDARAANIWIEHKDLGRVTLGRGTSAGVITTIDLGGIAANASGSISTMQGSFLISGPNQNQYYAMTMGTFFDPAANQARTEMLRYDSPTLAGFILSASINEAGDYWGAMLRYAGEFSGFRVAAGVGYEKLTDRQTQASPLQGPDDLELRRPEVEAWGAGLSVLHVPSGLFAQGHYMAAEFSCNTGDPNATTAGGVSQQWGQTTDCRADAKQWLVQGGITKNWFGIGNTALYGEYSVSTDFGAGLGAGRDFAATLVGTTAVTNVTGAEGTMWGVGIVQNLDAAATTMYLSYRNFSYDITCVVTCAAGQGSKLATEDLGVVIGGAVVRF